MNKTLRKIRISTFILSIVELLTVIVLTVFYTLNIFNFKSILNENVLIALVTFWSIVNLFFIIITISSVHRIRHKSDLQAAEILGPDIQEAYEFGMIGMAVVDEKQIVLWTNELLNDRKINIIDKNITVWQPKLEVLIRLQEETVNITINSRVYEVKFLADAHLYLFKDVTAYENLYEYNKSQAPVIGKIFIDNYSDSIEMVEEANDIILTIRNTLFNYARKFDLVLTRFRNDAYFVIMNYKSYQEILKDNFSVIKEVRNLSKDQTVTFTISFGLALDFPDELAKLNDMASSAVDVAISRGGDQVVVNQYGKELAFYGGLTQAQTRRNKIKVRTLADSLITLMKASSNIIVVAHTDMDMDALGSALGIKAIADSIKIPTQIIYIPKLIEKKTRQAVNYLFNREQMQELFIDSKNAMAKLKNETLVIVVDVHRPSFTIYPKILEEATKVVVIDHHRRGEEFIFNPIFSYIEPSASSTSEMVAELIRYASPNPRIDLPEVYATIMLSGIFLDTNYFRTMSTGARTFEASTYLKEMGADNSVADDLLKEDYEEHNLITKMMANSKTPHFGVVITSADQTDIIDRSILAKVANNNIQIRGVNATFVIGRVDENEIKVSARSDGTINVQLLIEKLGGGGHFTSAATSYKNETIEGVENKILEVLDIYLPQARNKDEGEK